MKISLFRLLLTFIACCSMGFSALAQTPTIQDCLGAVPICQIAFEDWTPPLGEGAFPDEIESGETCLDQEQNSIWYSFTAEQDGDLGFLITPSDINNDYDWALFDITNATCADVGSDPSILVSCNAAGGLGCNGVTGITVTGVGNSTTGGCAGTGPLNELVSAVAGQVFVLMVSNWNGTTDSYSMDFSESTIFTSFDVALEGTGFENTCPTGGNGYIEIDGLATETYDVTVSNAAGEVVYECLGCSGLMTTDEDLPGGIYSIMADIVGTGCPTTSFVTVDDGVFPFAMASVQGTPCETVGVNLTSSVTDAAPGTVITYEWTGPDATMYFGQDINAPDEGTYTLVAYVDGCPLDPVMVNVVFEIFTIDILGFDEICEDGNIWLTASGDGDQYSWTNLTTNTDLGTSSSINLTLTANATIQLTSTDSPTGCSTTAQTDITFIAAPNITIATSGSLCANESITLTASGAPGGSYQWADDPTAPNPRVISGLAPGPYTYTVTGTAASSCSAMADISFNIQAVPNVMFSVAPDPICNGDLATVTLTGTGINMIDWNGVGPANQNPINVPISGNTMIQADVTNANNCSETFTTTIIPDAPPAPTVISCGPNTPTSVVFNWTGVAGATSYTVTVMGQGSQTTSNTSLTIDNLMPNETVTITVQPTGAGICPPAPTTFSCTTQDCPNINLTITPVDLICLENFGPSMSLEFAADNMSGTPVWSGNGIIDANNGTFDPQDAGTGDHVISLEYTIGDCIYNAMTTIVIRQQPTPDFQVSNFDICAGEEVTISYDGNATAAATFDWDFDGGNANPGTGIGPHFVNWDASGSYDVSLIVSEDGCTSESFMENIFVYDPLEVPVIVCENVTTSSLTMSWNTVTGGVNYVTNVLTSQVGTQMGNSITFDNLSPNETVTLELVVDTDNPCGIISTTQSCTTINCPPYSINITPLSDICLTGSNTPVTLVATVGGGNGTGTITWSGPGVTGDQFDPTAVDAGVGQHTITATYTEDDCMGTAMTTVNVFNTPTADFTIVPTEVCINDDATITYNGTAGVMATYTWNFNGGVAVPGTGVGPHTVNWPTSGNKTVSLTVNENGCSNSGTQMISVLNPIVAPVINCAPSTSDIVFSWNAVVGASSYIVNLISAPPGATTVYDDIALTYTVSGLNANESVEIQVVAVDDGPCPNSSANQACVAENCPAVMINIDPVAPICLDANASTVNLNAVIAGGTGGGSEFWSGTGITDTLGVFDPADSGAGTWTVNVTYTEGNCQYNASLEIVVNAQPTADFTVDPTICQTSTATAIYTGSASAGVGTVYDWNFGTATANPGTGVGPHTLSWPAGGMQPISLTVTENNCASEVFNATVQVDEPLAQPVIICDATTSTITFSWGAVPNATGYIVNVISMPATATGVYDDIALTYSVTGLSAGESVEIQVVAEGDGACGNSNQTFSCVAQNCPMVTINIDQVTPICLNANAAVVNLNAVITGGAGGGSEFWSGIGITDTLGVFDPTDSGAGTWTITVTYTEGICEYTETIDITVNAQPSADFMLDNMNVCEQEPATVTYNGTAAANAIYAWDFDGGVALPGSGQGPHMVTWASSSMPIISLTVTQNNCASEPFNANVQVDAPLAIPEITCDATTTTVTFSWAAIPDATGYMVNEISIPPAAVGVYDDVALTYTVSGLAAGESAEVEVVALGDGACGNSSQTFSCVAQNCPIVTIDIDPVTPICLNANASIVNLNAVIAGGAGGGSEFWSGTGITDTLGVFDPNNAGAGDWTITVSYTEGNCQYTETIDITVNAQPSADFTIDNVDVCEQQPVIITYTGGAAVDAIYNWDFDDGAAIPGTGQGPHTVTWATGSMPNISLTVIENNCSSPIFNEMLSVADSLIAPVVNCDSDNTTLTFSWNPVVGATSYTVDVINEPAGASGIFDDVALTYSYTNLTPGDEITIQVNVLTDSPCGGVSTEMTCMSEPCDDLTFQETVFGPYCTDEGLQNLSTSIGTNNGTFTWSGAGVDNTAATFDPSTSGTGMIPVDVQYELTGCFFDTTFQIVVNAVPTASFTVDSPICVENTATLTFDGSASVAAVYSWDLDGGMIESGVDPGPYTVAWDAAGDYMITLNVTDNGCASNSFSLPVMVDAVIAPVEIICQTTSSTSVTFAWDPVAGADTYDVTVIAGPMGVQTGNTYTMTGLVPDEVVTIEVTASGSSVCGPSTAMGTCIAQACQSLTLAIDGSPTLCVGDDGQINFDFTTNQAGPFEVTYTVNGTQEQMIFDGDGMIALDNLTANTTVEVISIMDVNITECVYPGGQMWAIQVDQIAEAGQVTGNVDLCEGEVQVIDLNTLLTGADANGVWTETSTPSSTGGGFNATAGSFNTAGQAAQAYSFVYTIAGGACPDDSTETAVAVAPTPVADAGDNQMLTCVMGTATLGGNGSTPGETYQWTSTNPDAIIADPMDQFTEISSPGDYTLEVTNAAGCSSTDEVAVSAAFDVPVADVSISDPTCFEANDGNIIIDNVSGGVAPYTYSLNGGDMSSNTFFGNLNPGEYSLIVQGGNDCFTELFINIAQPEEVVVELVANIQNGDNIINLGETVVLEALYSPNINVDTIIWKPDTLDTEALNIINVTPQQTSTYTVTLIDANGCADSDDMTIIVQKPRPVYIPTAFSPDDSGSNDMFFIDGGSQIKQVKSFLIFNRWGESVFENRDFFAGDPSQGWDGKHRGVTQNPGVFVYFVEVEFIDGEVILYKGDFVLLR